MRVRLEARPSVPRALLLLGPGVAIALTVASGALLFWLLGFPPLEVLRAFFLSPLSSLYGLSELALKATPLALCAIGLSFGFRANVWNIGAEGQLVVGAIAAGGVALAFPGTESRWLLAGVLAAGAAGGAAWGAIPAWLRTRFHASEILVSLMLTYVALLLLSWLVHGPWKDPDGYAFPESRMFPPGAMLPILVEGTRLHAGAALALAGTLVGWALSERHLLGYQLKVAGFAPPAAGFAGFSTRRLVWTSLLIGGGLAGVAGALEVAGPIGQLLPSISPGYGFTAIIVAFLGRLHAGGILLAAALVALSYLGGESVQIELGLPLAAAGVFQGLLLFWVLASDVLVRYRIRVVPRPGATGDGVGGPAREARPWT